MVRGAGSRLAAGVTGLLIAATATAGIATASGAATGGPPADSVSRIPGTTRMLAGGFSHAPDDTKVVAVLLQSS